MAESTADMERIKADLAKLREDFGDLFDSAMALGKDSAGTAREKLAAGVVELKKAAAVAKEKGQVVVEGAQDKIRERPLTSVLIAFGLGVLIAKLLDRR